MKRLVCAAVLTFGAVSSASAGTIGVIDAIYGDYEAFGGNPVG